MGSVISLKDVYKTYHMGETKVHALRGLSMDVEEGEFLAVMGPSGSGKSTALHIIGALDVPTKGKVLLGGQDVSKLTENELAVLRGKKIGFVFQQFNLMQNLTALENVMLPMIFQGRDRAERVERGIRILEDVGLGERIDHKPTELSGGEQQRVAIARSLANDPDVVLADEPTGNLDSKTGKNVMKYLEKLHSESRTIVVVTHDKNIAKYAGRTIELKDGREK